MFKLPIQLKNNKFNFVRVKGKNPSVSGKDWQNQVHSFIEVPSWIKNGYNYGVMGGIGGLVIIDADSDSISEAVETNLPETFTVETGSGKKHYYFICTEIDKKIIFNDKLSPSLLKEGEHHYGEIITKGFQAVGAGSIHPNTKKLYKVFKDVPIVEISKEEILSALSLFLPPMATSGTSVQPVQTNDLHLEDLHVSKILGVDKTCNIIHPVHGAKNGGNMNVDIEKNLWTCYRCSSGGGVLDLIAVLEGIIDCSEAHSGFLRGNKFNETLKLARAKYGLREPITPKGEIDKPKSIVPTESMTFANLMTKEFPKARYTVDPFFEVGTLNMVSAPPNTWKSWLLFYMSAFISDGSKVLGQFEAEKSNVLIVNEEDSYRAVQDRFNLLGITNHKLPIYFKIAEGHKIDEKFMKELLSEAKSKDIKVVIFDSLRSMHTSEENDSTAMQGILDMLKILSRENITVIFTHHHRKKSFGQKGVNSESSRGSSAINAAISGHLSLEEVDREDGKFIVVSHLKSKAGEKLEPFEIKIEKLDGSVRFVYNGVKKTQEMKVDEIKSKLMYAFSDDPDTWKTVADFESIASKNMVRGALRLLVSQCLVRSLSRKEAINEGIDVGSTGKPNEKVYKFMEPEKFQAEFGEFGE